MIKTALGDIKIYDSVIHQMMTSEDGDVAAYIKRLGRETAAVAKTKAGRSTGRLRRSISMRRDPAPNLFGYSVLVGSDVRYAWLHHDGTRRHVIAARGNGFLSFRGRSGQVFTRSVQHPGTRANRFLTDALREVVGG